MANPNQVFTQLNQDTNTLLTVLSLLQTDMNMLNDDPSLAAAVAAQGVTRGWTLTEQDVTNWAGAVQQMLFTFNSGTPTNASLFYKLK